MKIPSPPNPKGTPDRTDTWASLTVFETRSNKLDIDVFFQPDGFDENCAAHLLIMGAVNNLRKVMASFGQVPHGYVQMTKEELEGT